jgi:uncharacterized protein (TIGR03437 family)
MRLGIFYALLLVEAVPNAAAENIVTAKLAASLDSGGLAGTRFPVNFSYDSDRVAAAGESYVPVESFDFVLGGVAFARKDIFQGGQVVFRDGKLSDVTASFQVVLPDNAPVRNITFGFGGYGVIGYIDLQGNFGKGSFDIASARAVVNSASLRPGDSLNAGCLASIFGSGMAFSRAQSTAIPLPGSLAETTVTVGGIRAPLLYVSPGQINFQVPWNVPAGSAYVVVSNAGIGLDPFRVAIGTFAPGVFTLGSGSGQAVAVNPDGSLAAPPGSVPGVTGHPATPGQTITIYATGLGAAAPSIASGSLPSDGVRATAVTPVVLIGGVSATVTASRMSAQFVGVDEITAVVPSIAPGMAPLQIGVNGVMTSTAVTIAVGQ